MRTVEILLEEAKSEIETRKEQYRKAVLTIYDLRQELDLVTEHLRMLTEEMEWINRNITEVDTISVLTRVNAILAKVKKS